MTLVDPMFILATAAFAFGLSLVTYRWFAVHNGWPMGEWQAHRPGLPIAIGVFSILIAMLFAMARSGPTLLIVPLLGVLCALTWTALTRVGAQSALIFAPAAAILLVLFWYWSAMSIPSASQAMVPPLYPTSDATPRPDATDTESRLRTFQPGQVDRQPPR